MEELTDLAIFAASLATLGAIGLAELRTRRTQSKARSRPGKGTEGHGSPSPAALPIHREE